MTDSDSRKRRVLAANAAFYAAFRGGDMAAMEALWSLRAEVGVYHPSAAGIEGRGAVMRSWRAILVEGAPPAIFPVDPMVVLLGRTAMVVCEEELGDARTIATNVFADEDGAWRMVHHQATRLPAASGGGQGNGGGRGRREER